jgi:uncharacterized protein
MVLYPSSVMAKSVTNLPETCKNRTVENVDRHIEPALRVALSDTRVVSLVGPRQAGKSTIARKIVANWPNARYMTLDDSAARLAASNDPEGLVGGDRGLLVIDEIQRVPALILAIKVAVDNNPRPGQFLLTGSTHLLAVRDVADTLAGRIDLFEMWPFSQGERARRVEDFIDSAFADSDLPAISSSMAKRDYLELVVAGGYPEAVGRTDRRRSDWFGSYIKTVIERESKDVIDTDRGGDIVRLLRFIAARHSGLLNVADLARDAGLPERTTHRYLHLLESVFLVTRTPAWWANLTSQLTKSPKITIADSGLAAHLRRADVEMLSRPERAAGAEGPLIEGFVLGELRRQLSWSDTRADLFHFRDKAGREADALLEGPDGRIVAIEIKSSTSLSTSAFDGLVYLRDKLGDRFHRGIVMHSGPETRSQGDRLWSMPISALWSGGPATVTP